MTLLYFVSQFAGEPAVRSAGITHLFLGEPPDVSSIITCDPAKAQVTNNISRLPSTAWRRIELRELLDPTWPPQERRRATWRISQAFSFEEIAEFCNDNVDELLRRVGEITAAPTDVHMDAASKAHADFIQICSAAVNALPNSLHTLRAEITARVDEARVDAFFARPQYTRADIDELLGQLSDHPQRLRLMHMWIDLLIAEGLSNVQIETELKACRALEARDMSSNPKIWERLGQIFEWSQDLSGETINLSAAREVRFVPIQPYLHAKRTGRIKRERPALVVFEADSRTPKYVIGADRRLQFKVLATGGLLRKWGATFTMGTQDDSFAQALLEVERLEVLANVNPAAALAEVHDELPEEHPIRDAAVMAETDYRWGRILADLLIEFTVGLDADIARRLIRSRSSSR